MRPTSTQFGYISRHKLTKANDRLEGKVVEFSEKGYFKNVKDTLFESLREDDEFTALSRTLPECLNALANQKDDKTLRVLEDHYLTTLRIMPSHMLEQGYQFLQALEGKDNYLKRGSGKFVMDVREALFLKFKQLLLHTRAVDQLKETVKTLFPPPLSSLGNKGA